MQLTVWFGHSTWLTMNCNVSRPQGVVGMPASLRSHGDVLEKGQNIGKKQKYIISNMLCINC